MPELPEVETVVRTLGPRIVGRRIVEVRALSRRVVPRPIGRAAGGTVQAVRRLGKHILVELDRGILDIHLGMTGAVLVNATPGPYTRAWFRLDSGTLIYNDPRMFGRIRFGKQAPAGLGPDPLEVGAGEFARLLGGRRARLKPLLLNQRFLRGVGNIYADEALFGAGIHPRALACRLSPARAGRLHAALVEVLEDSIARGGTSISDYVDAEGRAGYFQQRLRVYGRGGLPCLHCGTSIRRVVLAGRGTHYCPRCQRV
jgi:formamidopyrimidine-DNA glycosylase